MTRLDSAIRRLMAQRALLDWAAQDIANRSGLVLELGLGNGRTYDHLRDRLPDREIYAFERQPAAHPDCTPPANLLVVGDMFDTLPTFLNQAGPECAALIHADIGSGDAEANRMLAKGLSPLLEPLLAPGGLLLADRALDLTQCRDISAEAGVGNGRYYVYRR